MIKQEQRVSLRKFKQWNDINLGFRKITLAAVVEDH